MTKNIKLQLLTHLTQNSVAFFLKNHLQHIQNCKYTCSDCIKILSAPPRLCVSAFKIYRDVDCNNVLIAITSCTVQRRGAKTGRHREDFDTIRTCNISFTAYLKVTSRKIQPNFAFIRLLRFYPYSPAAFIFKLSPFNAVFI
jgi:hypothetical protein